MRERAGAVGGRLAADPRPDGGFLVTAELPLRTGARDDGPVHEALAGGQRTGGRHTGRNTVQDTGRDEAEGQDRAVREDREHA